MLICNWFNNLLKECLREKVEGRFWDATGIRNQSSALCYINKKLKENIAGTLIKFVDNAQLEEDG